MRNDDLRKSFTISVLWPYKVSYVFPPLAFSGMEEVTDRLVVVTLLKIESAGPTTGKPT